MYTSEYTTCSNQRRARLCHYLGTAIICYLEYGEETLCHHTYAEPDGVTLREELAKRPRSDRSVCNYGGRDPLV
jgi:hypothetical protein